MKPRQRWNFLWGWLVSNLVSRNAILKSLHSSFSVVQLHWGLYLICKRYWALWIASAVPVIVMMRSSESVVGSSILMPAPDFWRISLMRVPPLPMISPASLTMALNEWQCISIVSHTAKKIYADDHSIWKIYEIYFVCYTYIFWYADLRRSLWLKHIALWEYTQHCKPTD